MKCPHCLQNFSPEWTDQPVEWPEEDRIAIDSDDTAWFFRTTKCPSCRRLVIYLRSHWRLSSGIGNVKNERLVQPKGVARAPLPAEVPPENTADYQEACAVLPDSAKASAALSRRCLQHLLREEAKTKKRDLLDQIIEVIPNLPSHLTEAVDAVRNIGNFAAHPIKSTNTGEIVDVEPGEAEWNLEVLEGLFDFYFVQPAILKKKRDALNVKLTEAKRPPMK
jgi:Domain of unknown function (DUF4145)